MFPCRCADGSPLGLGLPGPVAVALSRVRVVVVPFCRRGGAARAAAAGQAQARLVRIQTEISLSLRSQTLWTACTLRTPLTPDVTPNNTELGHQLSELGHTRITITITSTALCN